MRRIVHISLSVLALVVFRAGVAMSQTEQGGNGLGGGSCDTDIQYGCSGDYGHTTSSGTSYGNGHGTNQCYVCLYYGDPTDASDCHDCGGLDHVTAAAYSTILKASRAGDVTTVMAVAQRVRGFVFFNEQRASVQILACDKVRVIANMPLKTAVQAHVAAVLPRLGTAQRTAVTQ